jgi:hypothetical protein
MTSGKMSRVAVSGLLLLVSVTAIRSSAKGEDSEVCGLVTSSDHAAIPRATLRLVNQSTGTTRTTHTSSNGSYLLRALPPGTYDLGISKEGFQPINRVGITLEAAARVRLNFIMQSGSSTAQPATSGRVNEET